MRTYISVFIGGIIGTGIRLAIDTYTSRVFQLTATDFPMETLLINLVGALILGWLTGSIWSDSTPQWVRAGLSTGLLGAFTTFSAVMTGLVQLANAEAWGVGVSYILVSVVGGVACASLGMALGRARRQYSTRR